MFHDHRAVSAAVTHVIAIAIITILLSGLIVSASGALEDEQERASRLELRTIGDRIAAGITSLDLVAETGASVSLELRLSRQVGGESYTVSLRDGAACSDVATDADSCLSLRVASSSDPVLVPAMNRSPVSIEEHEPGRFELRSKPQVRDLEPDQEVSADVAPNIGVGAGVTRSVVAQEPAEQPRPIAGFSFEPTAPGPSETISFNATGSEGLGTTLSDYDWTFDDGTTKSGENVTHSFADEGVHTANLTVSDEDGRSDSVEKVVKVTGLVYNGDVVAADTESDGTRGGVELSFSNQFSDQIVIKQVQVNTTDDSIDGLGEWTSGVYEFQLQSPQDTVRSDSATDIPDAGLIYDLESYDSEVTVSSSDDVTLRLNEFQTGPNEYSSEVDMTGETLIITVRYEHDGTNFVTRVEVAP